MSIDERRRSCTYITLRLAESHTNRIHFAVLSNSLFCRSIFQRKMWWIEHHSLDWKEGLTKLKFVCLSVTGSKEHYRARYELRDVLMLIGVIRCGELESGVRFSRMTMVARQPIRTDFTEMGFSGGFETWETWICSQFDWSVRDWLTTNWNRVRRKQLLLRYLDGENMNLSSADREGHGRWSCIY